MTAKIINLEDDARWRFRKKGRAYELFVKAIAIDEQGSKDEDDEEARAEAMRLYSQVVLLDPEFAAAWTNLGNCYYFDDEYELAIHAYNKALLLEPRQFEAHLNLGITYMDVAVGDEVPEYLRTSMTHLITAHHIDQKVADPTFRLGDLFRLMKQTEKAKYWYALFLTMEKDTPMAVLAQQRLDELGNPYHSSP